MTENNSAPYYRNFLVTVWEERGRDPEVPVTWRFSLKDPNNGRQQGFAGLSALMKALEEEIAKTEILQMKGSNEL